MPQQPDDLGSEVADPLVVAGLAGDVGEEVAEATPEERRKRRSLAQSSSTWATAKQSTSASEMRGLRPRPGRVALGQEFVGLHVKCDEKVVEVGGHESTSVWSALLGHTGLRRPFFRPYSAHRSAGRLGIRSRTRPEIQKSELWPFRPLHQPESLAQPVLRAAHQEKTHQEYPTTS